MGMNKADRVRLANLAKLRVALQLIGAVKADGAIPPGGKAEIIEGIEAWIRNQER
jgi:hypothetical protein